MHTLLYMLRHPIKTYYEWRFIRTLEKALEAGASRPPSIGIQHYVTWGGATPRDYTDFIEDGYTQSCEDRVLEKAKSTFKKTSKKK